MKFGFSVAAAIMAMWATIAFAVPMNKADMAQSALSAENSAVIPVHGFHCKPAYGWDGRVGAFRWHSHEGICHDWKRCFAVYKFCQEAFGEGFRQHRADKCMFDRGCY
jgi:hypothetical protein